MATSSKELALWAKIIAEVDSGNSSGEEEFSKPNLLEDAEKIKALSIKLLTTEKTLENFFNATFSLEFLKWEIQNECRLKDFLKKHNVIFSCKKLDLPAQRFQGWNQRINPELVKLNLETLKSREDVYQAPLHPVFIIAKESSQRAAHSHDEIVQTIIEEESQKELTTFKNQLFQLFLPKRNSFEYISQIIIVFL